jgi:hypothetical protein
MVHSWIPKLLVPVSVGLAFTAFRKYFPPHLKPDQDRRREGKRLPTGIFSIVTVAIGIVIAIGGYFLLLGTNRLLAKADGSALAQIYPPSEIWCFLPGFAALALPWPLTIAILRHSTYRGEAAYIETEAGGQSGFDCFRVMAGLNIFIVLPIAVLTLLALPERLTLKDNQILWTHYASLVPERFLYEDIVRLTGVEGYLLRDGSFKSHRDLLIDFKDGRRLNANAVGDGGSVPSAKTVNIFLEKTGLIPGEVKTLYDLPTNSSSPK